VKGFAHLGKIVRFGVFEVNLQTGEARKHGIRIKLQGQPYQILAMLLERAGGIVTQEEIRLQLWPDGTFVEFEDSVHSAVKKLRQALGDSTDHPSYVETLPRVGYRFIAPVERGMDAEAPAQRGAGTAVDGVEQRRAEAMKEQSHGRKWLVSVPIVLLLAASSLLFWSHFRTHARAGNRRVMMAVLPLENLTGDASQDYFCDGLTEEMIAQLGRVDPQHLGVIARTSVMRYKQMKESLNQVGRELGVQYVLEGSVRRDTSIVRVSVELVQMKDQASVWSSEYDRDLSELLNLQGEIAHDIARETRLTLENSYVPIDPGRKTVVSPSSYEAYDLYLKGRYFWNKRTKNGFQRAAEYFQQSIAKDPYYGRAYAGLADTYGLMSTWRFVSPNEFMPKAQVAARKALEIDDTLAEAHTSLALVLENYNYDWQGAEKQFRRAIELDPNYATAHQWYAEYLSWQGRFNEALEESERARQLDPLSLIVATDHGAILYFARQYDQAIAQFRAVLDMEPNFDRARLLLACAYVEKGRFEEARDILEYRADPDDLPMTWGTKVYVYGRWGQTAAAQQSMARVQQIVRHSEADPTGGLLFAYLGLNQNDQAIALLQKASLERSNAIAGAKVAPYDDPLRSDPRFQALLESTGLGQ